MMDGGVEIYLRLAKRRPSIKMNIGRDIHTIYVEGGSTKELYYEFCNVSVLGIEDSGVT